MTLLGGVPLAFIPLTACASAPFKKLVKELKNHPEYQGTKLDFKGYDGVPDYSVYVHNNDVVNQLRSKYISEDQITPLISIPNVTITTENKNGHTFIPAADVDASQGTNYDAIWVRDSIWGYYALLAQDQVETAKNVLLGQCDYFASAAQKQRINIICHNPELINDPQNGQMNAVHIRFNADSSTFDDVQENGKPQSWNHKQNDALGLFLDALLTGVKNGTIVASDITSVRMDAVVGLVEYLYKVKFWLMEDSGAWEEAQRLNTSSVGIVVSAIESLTAIPAENTWFWNSFNTEATTLGYTDLDTNNRTETLNKMKDYGYKLIHTQIKLGGESPNYPTNDKRYRTADAALLNLIYPAKLSQLTIEEKEKVFHIVSTLMTDWGIKRYQNDNYQSGNFWFNQIKTDTDSSSIAKRDQDFIEGSEASWFFDSWMAHDAILLASEDATNQDFYNSLATMYFNRSLAFITGNGLHGDGTPCHASSLPESYNVIVDAKNWWRVPSPIDPLNWAKSSFVLMNDVIKNILP